MERDAVVLSPAQLGELLERLRAEGFELVGPTVRQDAIVLDSIAGLADLPRGVGDEQAPGRYRLRDRGDDALFGHAAPATSPKRELFVPRATLVQIRRRGRALEVHEPVRATRRLAFVGIKPCEVAAIAIQDRVFLGDHQDPDYAARREGAFVLVAHCGEPSGTCFCVSMGTGPRADRGFDLAATEILGPPHRLLIEVGSDRGAAILADLGAPATEDDRAAAAAVTDRARARMGRTLETEGLPAALQANPEHPRWADVAERCLGCANCTMACPTCFCSTIEDTTDLSGDEATRTRRWDSCFTVDFGYVHGGTVRPSLRARYRQWLTHKLSTWHDQLGSSGCVGCGRCITWCPVGIDITVEAAAVAGHPPAVDPTPGDR